MTLREKTMIKQGSGVFVLVTGIAIGLAIGIGMSSNHQSASAATTGSAQKMEKAIAKNATAIADLQRKLAALDRTTATLGKKVRGNRRAASTIASKSGIRLDFRDN
jgi:hypothetical protein